MTVSCLAPATLLLAWAVPGLAAGPGTALDAADFGVLGDGVTDDGPAIQRLVAAGVAAGGPVCLRFAPGRVFRVETAPGRYVFRLEHVSEVTVDGGGSTFLLAPDLRFLTLTDSDHVTVQGLSVDFSPLPFADGTVTAVDAERRCLDVRLAPGVAVPAGGPTGEDGEQAFFAMLWHDGPYGTLSAHYWVERIEALPEPGMVRVYAGESFDGFGQVEPGAWRMSLPVPGIAHRYGPGPCFRIADNDTVTVQDVELWSTPWFGYEVSRNRGTCTFRRASIRPKPGSGRLMSTWRDGYHVKGNSASLLWEDCVLAGMNDDAFNISTHSSRVLQVLSPTQVEVGQRFPLLPIPWEVGATFRAVDEPSGRLLGDATVVVAERGPEPPPIQGSPAAPTWRLTLDHPLAGLGPVSMVWDPDLCNPDTTLRRCRISMSCRLQSPVHVDQCDVDALLWFYGEGIEGAFPAGARVTNSILRRGRGNPTLALAVSGGPVGEARGLRESWEPPRAVHDVTIEGNEIWGSVAVEGAQRLRLAGNQFREAGATVSLTGDDDCQVTGNTGPTGEPFEPRVTAP
jgi:hypothetical protein